MRVYRDHSFSGDETNQDYRYGFFGCTSVSCKGFFLMVVSSHEIHENFHENTKNKKKWLDGTQVVPSPVPHAKFSKINEIHEKGDRGGVSR